MRKEKLFRMASPRVPPSPRPRGSSQSEGGPARRSLKSEGVSPRLPAWSWALVAISVAVGAWLRFDRLDLMEYKYDEAQMYRLATRQATGDFQKVGLVSGVGVRDPATAVYLFSLIRSVTSEPVALAYLPAFLGVLAIPLCFLLTRETLGLWAALTATLLAATAPWSVMYSRKIWIQDLIPCFTTVAMWSAFRLIRTRQPVYAAAFAILTAIMIQIHYSSLVLLLIGLALMVWVRRRRVYVGWAVGIAIGLLTFAPFLIHQVRHDFEDFRSVFHMAEGKHVARAGLARTIYHLANMTSYNWFREYVVGERSQAAYDASTVRCPVMPGVMAALLALGVAMAIVKTYRSPPHRLLLLWLALPPVVWSIVPDVAHYQIIALPAPFIAIGVLVESLRPRGKPRVGLPFMGFVAAGAVVLLASVAHVLFFHSFLNFIETNGGAQGDYGVAYRYLDASARHLAGHARRRTFDGAVFTGRPVALARLAMRHGAGLWTRGDRSVIPDVFFVLQRADAETDARPKGYSRGVRYEVGPFHFDVWMREPATAS